MKTATKNDTPEVNEPIGRLIDGSAESADYINEETIALAESYGFESGIYDKTGPEENREIWAVV